MRLFKPDFVLLGCPPAISGGSESIHQLAQVINDLGVQAEILYAGRHFEIKKNKLKMKPDKINLDFSLIPIELYVCAKYVGIFMILLLLSANV